MLCIVCTALIYHAYMHGTYAHSYQFIATTFPCPELFASFPNSRKCIEGKHNNTSTHVQNFKREQQNGYYIKCSVCVGCINVRVCMLCMYVCACAHVCAFACVWGAYSCVRVRAFAWVREWVYVYVCLCVCVYMCSCIPVGCCRLQTILTPGIISKQTV